MQFICVNVQQATGVALMLSYNLRGERKNSWNLSMNMLANGNFWSRLWIL